MERHINGVPQRSGLGPLAFSIFINDLNEEVEGIFIKYADDTKLNEFINILEDRNNVQNVIYRLANRPKANNDI